MGCSCKGKPVAKPQPTPVPQTVEQYHAQSMADYENNLDEYHFIQPNKKN